MPFRFLRRCAFLFVGCISAHAQIGWPEVFAPFKVATIYLELPAAVWNEVLHGVSTGQTQRFYRVITPAVP